MSFENFYHKVMTSKLGHVMRAIFEDSPWHREANVSEHTRMTIRWYEDNIASSRTTEQQLLTKLALLFHDTGKPMARTEKFSEARGTYYSYPGHELMSARVFEDYILTHWQELEKDLGQPTNWTMIEKVKCLIEHHLPYEKTGKDKLIALKTHIRFLGSEELEEAYFDVLRSDAHGRISDDPDGTYIRVEKWISQFQSVQPKEVGEIFNRGVPYIILAIGASGSGKSTYFMERFSYDDADGPSEYLFSLDDLRLAFYGSRTGNEPIYDVAWNYIHRNEDKQVEKEFDAYCLKEFSSLVRERFNIFVDISNVSAKSRRRWITLARQHGYNVFAVHFAIPYQVCLNRQSTRGDKQIHERSVQQQYFRISTPLIGTEVDAMSYTFSFDFDEVTKS